MASATRGLSRCWRAPLGFDWHDDDVKHVANRAPPNGLELSCPAEAGNSPLIVAQGGWPGAPPYGPARRVSFSELFGGSSPESCGLRLNPTANGSKSEHIDNLHHSYARDALSMN